MSVPNSVFLGVYDGQMPTVSTVTAALNAATTFVEYIVQASRTLSVDTIKLNVSGRTGTQPTYRVSLQGVTAAGRADGTILASGNAFVDWVPAANGQVTLTLGAAATIAQGTIFAIVVIYQSGTIGASNLVTLTNRLLQTPALSLPHIVTVNSGTPTLQALIPPLGWGNAASNSYDGCVWSTNGLVSVNSSATPQEYGSLITIPADMAASYQVAGAYIMASPGNLGTADFELRLYQGSSTTPDQTLSVESGQLATTGTGLIKLLFTGTLVTITGGTTIRLSVRGTDATSVSIQTTNQLSVNDWDSSWTLGQAWLGCNRKSGTWTDDTLTRYFIAPILTNLATGNSTYTMNNEQPMVMGRMRAAGY